MGGGGTASPAPSPLQGQPPPTDPPDFSDRTRKTLERLEAHGDLAVKKPQPPLQHTPAVALADQPTPNTPHAKNDRLEGRGGSVSVGVAGAGMGEGGAGEGLGEGRGLGGTQVGGPPTLPIPPVFREQCARFGVYVES